MSRFKYLLLAIVSITGLIAATPIEHGAKLPPMTALAVTIQNGEVDVGGYAAPEMRDRVTALVSTMQSGTAQLTEQSLEISGVASSDAGFGTELAVLRNEMPQHIATTVDVFVIDAGRADSDVCERMFEAVSALPARFDETGMSMRTSSQPILDRIVDFAEDCDESRIELVGHSDSTGPEAANVALSLARAQRIADHLIARGVDGERLILSGVGSAEPIADNGTRLGRERNRRVEFRLRL